MCTVETRRAKGGSVSSSRPRRTRPDRAAHNAEPHKYAELGWFLLDALAGSTVPYITTGVGPYRRGRPFAALHWDAEA
jgi:hypothetical protein